MRAKCFDITRRAVDAIAQHQPPLLRCDALSTALLHHYFYRCRVLAAQKKWRERTQRRRKRLARTATSIRVVGGVRRARRPGCATSTPPAVAAHTISAAARRRSVGSDGGLHLWNDSEWPMATTTSAAATLRTVPARMRARPLCEDAIAATCPSAPVATSTTPRWRGYGDVVARDARRSSLGRPSDTPAPL